MNVSDVDGLVNDYGRDLYGFCRHLAVNVFDSEDLYQRTFLKAVELAHKIDKSDNPKSFLFSLAAGIWKNDVRKYARRNRIAPSVPIEDYDEEIQSVQNPVESIADKNEIKNILNDIINNLDDNFKIPILLFYSSGFSEKEISSILKLPVGTVKSRLYRAKKLIRLRLEETGYEEF